MARPKLPRRIRCKPSCKCFNPDVLKDNKGVILERDEYQAIKLYDVDGFDQKKCSIKMEISQPTFARILQSARKKISKAIVLGKKISLSLD